jgi:hypothetical protein
MRFLPLLALLVAPFVLEGTALARGDIYVNGTKVDGLTSQTFEKARVRFDAKGDVYIDVEGVNIQVVQTEGRPGAALTPAPGPVGARYFVEASQFRLGLAQFDVEVHINGKTAASFPSERPQAAIEVTQYLRNGDNQVLFVANKTGGVRRSHSRRDYVRVSFFRGTVQGENVLVGKVLRTFERTAAHTASSAEEHRVKVE